MSWDCPVFPIDAKNSIDFLVQFFLSYAPLVGDSDLKLPLTYWADFRISPNFVAFIKQSAEYTSMTIVFTKSYSF